MSEAVRDAPLDGLAYGCLQAEVKGEKDVTASVGGHYCADRKSTDRKRTTGTKPAAPVADMTGSAALHGQ
ncbi:hypothetical protein MTO96_022186 [Rhipicephalus appendiculatus]